MAEKACGPGGALKTFGLPKPVPTRGFIGFAPVHGMEWSLSSGYSRAPGHPSTTVGETLNRKK